jgi:hypothetical protein
MPTAEIVFCPFLAFLALVGILATAQEVSSSIHQPSFPVGQLPHAHMGSCRKVLRHDYLIVTITKDSRSHMLTDPTPGPYTKSALQGHLPSRSEVIFVINPCGQGLLFQTILGNPHICL